MSTDLTELLQRTPRYFYISPRHVVQLSFNSFLEDFEWKPYKIELCLTVTISSSLLASPNDNFIMFIFQEARRKIRRELRLSFDQNDRRNINRESFGRQSFGKSLFCLKE